MDGEVGLVTLLFCQAMDISNFHISILFSIIFMDIVILIREIFMDMVTWATDIEIIIMVEEIILTPH